MMQLAARIARVVAERVVAAAGGSGEARLIFHGPPLDLLSAVFDELLKTGDELGVPVVLQVPSLPDGGANPPIGKSGRCTEGHLLDLRNSPANPSYLALVPPGQRAIMSVTSTTDEFGLSASSDGGNASFSDWWADPFVEAVVSDGLDGLGLAPRERPEAEALAARAASAIDSVDPLRSQRAAIWRLLGRIFSIPQSKLPPAVGLSLACGVPPMQEGGLSAGEQQASLDGVAGALADGFRSGLDGPMESANEEQSVWLGEFLAHIRAVCEVPTALERAAEPFYLPSDGALLAEPPAWWRGLTAERWAELLTDEPEIVGDITIAVKNALLPQTRNVPLLVEDSVELVISIGSEGSEPVPVLVQRSLGKTAGGFPVKLGVERQAEFVDTTPPRHKSPLQYKVSAEQYRPASAKVVSLASWAPGIFVACRLARKIVPPKAPARRARGATYETSISLPGPGRYELLVFLSNGVCVAPQARGSGGEGTASDEAQELAVREFHSSRHQIEVEVDRAYQIDLSLTRMGDDGKVRAETCRTFLSCDDVTEEGCRSEFERLIKLNRRQIEPGVAKPVVQLNRSARTSTLQGWMLQEADVSVSYLPVVLAEDYGDHWAQPKWEEEQGRVFSAARFLTDPRPPASHFVPPPGFVEARVGLAEILRGTDQSNLVESTALGDWLRSRDDFASHLERYLDAYTAWLKAAPEVAKWVDITCVSSLEPGDRTISRVPDAVLLSPLHPLRLAWHAVAQGVLEAAASSNSPCPAAAVLDPGVVPDVLHLPLISPEGLDEVPFLAVESNSDYWSVLWNGSKLRSLPSRSCMEPFGPALGLSIGGISTGFSASQVGRALDDVSNVLCAKPSLTVFVASAGGATEACNDGLVDWSTQRFGEQERRERRHWLGPRRLDVFDGRDAGEMPDGQTIANLSEDTENNVRWFVGEAPGPELDLGITAQLESSEPEASVTTARSAIGAGGLLRHRIRKQLPGAFLSESRQALLPPASRDALADKVGVLLASLESGPSGPVGLRFAPDVHAIASMLEEKGTDFVAISSSAVDPACFLGGWLPNSYLWDYDLPSYSHKAGDTNGYYLVSRIKPADRDGLKKVLARLPGGDRLQDSEVEAVLLEVARRGIPTIRGLSGDDTGAAGDLGLFVASRLLQDRFRMTAGADSLVPVLGGTAEEPQLALVIPVDPFRGFLEDLSKALGKERPDTTLSRPDLLVIAVSMKGTATRIHLTPVEVKCRLGGIFPPGDIEDALTQAKSLSNLLTCLSAHNAELSAWRLTYQHLLLSVVGFGMRVYSQHRDLAGGANDWSAYHERIAQAILSEPDAITVDARGRLIIVDDTPVSDALDSDTDGFEEVIVVSPADAGRILGSDAQSFYDGVKAKVGDWDLLPAWVHPSARGEPNLHQPGPSEAPAPVPVPAVPAELDSTCPLREEVAEEQSAAGGIRLEVGVTVDGFEPRNVALSLSDTRLNQLNIGVVGDLGTGKTQLLKSLIHQIASAAPANRGISPRILVFDYKRDYSSEDFVSATGARVVKPHRLPLNLFDTRDLGESLVPWLDRFRFFADVLDKIYSGIGPVQRDKLKRAVKAAYGASSGQEGPTIYEVHAAYSDLLEGKSDSPMSIIDDLVDMEIFESDPSKCVTFDAFLDGVVVISLDALGQDDRSKNMLVAVMLNMFYENMLRVPKRPFTGTEPQLRAIDSYLLIDEADNIMRYEFDVLRKLLLQGREFGCGVILASQYLRHFKAPATDYREPLLTWFVHKVPNLTPAELSALGLGAAAADMAERIKSLPNHQCLYKSFDVAGQIVRGLPFYELVRREAGAK